MAVDFDSAILYDDALRTYDGDYLGPDVFWPGINLKIDWDGDGFATPIDDRTADFKSISWSRGADKASPGRVGTATITVRDLDGTYVDTNPDSPLLGHLRPGAPVWVVVSWFGVPHGLFAGYIDEIVPMPHAYEAQILCSDLLARLPHVQLRPPTDLATLREVREWVLDRLDIPEAQRDLSLNEGMSLHRVPSSGSAMEILEAVNNAVGSTHAIIPGPTAETWQRYTVIDRHHGLTQVDPDVEVDGTEHIKQAGFGGWRTTLSTVVNRVSVSGQAPPDSYAHERASLWSRTAPLFIRAGESRDVWADIAPARDLELVVDAAGVVTASIEEVGWDTAKITLEADVAADAVVRAMSITGRPGDSPGNTSVQVDNESSQSTYGVVQEGDNVDSSLVGEAIAGGAARYVVGAEGEPRKKPTVLLMEDFDEILGADVASLAGVTLARLFVAGRRMRVAGIDGDAANGVVWSVQWHLIDEQDVIPDLWVLGTSELGSARLGT